MDRDEAGDKVFGRSRSVCRAAWEALDDVLVAAGLDRYVKTIDVSYTDTAGNVVASVHPGPQTDSIEVAQSIADVDTHPALYDAAHVRWRTLPVAIRLGGPHDLTEEIQAVLDLAVAEAGTVTPRPVEDFYRYDRSKRRWGTNAPS